MVLAGVTLLTVLASVMDLAGVTAGLVGAGVSYPLTKQVSATADYSYQFGQKRVDQFNGNTVAVGLKYSF